MSKPTVPSGTSDHRADSSAALHPLIADRWSPRNLDPTAELTMEQLRPLFEAARWAPSWGNSQPARYLVGIRGTETFDRIAATLSRGNKAWAPAAAALVIGVAVVLDEEGRPLPYGEYGLGLATQNLVLQAVAEGLVAHQMAGFDAAAIAEEFGLPDSVEPRVAIAVGTLAQPDTGPLDLRERDAKPRRRRALDELVSGEAWGTPAF
ncbi:nitroreductase [Actinoalloteichus hoggarensis]|uniref:Malonic semialdehyde reductase n=1 Tax=Actinoalloteichus hoggarensis TaxID=1470176 RepID=A0A221VWN3_9PSEU|nr:nitroreductase family protein [Actinoalloteichus hoggarensis]ASO17877.1 malonic semialdehyde reductase [Actinoalloteichus hoggarensis]MBB5924289.1 nitroreductase [Actinoalloteichus hoggarensis]